MKYFLCEYNHFKQIDETVIGVNLRKRIIFSLDLEKYNQLMVCKSNINDLQEINPFLFSALVKLGVIIEAKVTSDSLLLNNRQLVFDPSVYRLTINPTLNCNFSCWYCYETHSKKRMKNSTIDSTLKFIEHIILEKKISKLYLDWFGGEPLLTYNTVMKPLALKAKEICDKYKVEFESGITTNGYLISKEMIAFLKEINMQSFQITLDGKKDVHNNIRFHKNKIGSYDRIVNNIILLANEITPRNLALRINYTSESIDDIHLIINSFPVDIRNKITVLLQQVWQDKEKKKITVEVIENLKSTFNKAGFLTDKYILNFKGYTCYADLYNQAVINYDGRVFKCTARNFEEEEADGILTNNGEIMWSESLLPLKLAKATFENNKCLSCKYLPICFGPCSQKVSTVKKPQDFEKYCFKGGIESTLDYIMTEFEKSGKAIAPLLEYR